MDESVVKHLPKVDHTPAELPSANRTLLLAAALIESHGWVQNSAGKGIDGGFCLVHSITHAARDLGSEWMAAYNLVCPRVGGFAALWNDAPTRTKEEVVAKLRAVALSD